MNRKIITQRNKKGESRSEALARGQAKHPDAIVKFEDPDTPPLAADEVRGPNWLNEYARDVTGDTLKYRPENPATRGLNLLQQIWTKLLPSIKANPVADVGDDLPSDVSKWAVLPDWLEMMVAHPHTQRNVFDWLDSWVPKRGHTFRGGASTVVRRPKALATARFKQYGQGFNDPTPAFTFHGERLPYMETRDMGLRLIRQARSRYPDPYLYDLDVEALDNWRKVQGGRSSTYVFCESSILFHGMTPHQETHSPIPWDVYWQSWNKVLEREFPGYGVGQSTLIPSELFIGTSTSGGIVLNNKEGAAGYPYTNMDRDQLRDALKRPKFKGRATKGAVFPHALRVLRDWIVSGMPMEGDKFEAVAQAATLGYRGDRQVDLSVRALASRGSDASYHDTANQLAAVLPSRSIIIVSTVLVLAQSTFAQPLGNHISVNATPGFDWVDPDHTTKRLDNIRQLDLQQGGGSNVATVGADASGYDRDVTGQTHAGECAWFMSMFPKKASLLYVDAPLPMDVDPTWVKNRKAELQEGGTKEYTVTGILPDGSEQLQTVTAELLNFDYWEFISKIMTMINHSTVRWADYELSAPGVSFELTGANPEFKDYPFVSNGGRRSGDGATGLANTWGNLVMTDAAAVLSGDPKYSRLRARRAALQDTPVSGEYSIVDAFARGDDLALAIGIANGVVPSEAVASGLCSVGMRANAKKQEASDIPGTPIFGFANVIVTEKYMGKLLGRSLQRYMVQESRGLSVEMLNALAEEGNPTSYSDSLLATTATAKSRLAPLAGFPLMSEHPVVESIVEWAVHNDEYRLAYVVEDAFDESGELTEEAKTEMKRAAETEASVQARLRARRENVGVDLERLKEVYAGSTIHDYVENVALVKDYSPTKAMKRVDNHALFKEAVRQGKPLEL